jgi:hypothetical protein
MRAVVVLAVLAIVALPACGASGGGDSAQSSAPIPPGGEVPASDQAPHGKDGKSITGTFGGSAQLEGGCAWVKDGATKWEVEWPAGYSVTFDPLTLKGPKGKVAAEGDTLTLQGTPQRDAMTICQVGPLFKATDVVAGGG